MAENKATYEFAIKYHSLYVNPQTTERYIDYEYNAAGYIRILNKMLYISALKDII